MKESPDDGPYPKLNRQNLAVVERTFSFSRFQRGRWRQDSLWQVSIPPEMDIEFTAVYRLKCRICGALFVWAYLAQQHYEREHMPKQKQRPWTRAWHALAGRAAWLKERR